MVHSVHLVKVTTLGLLGELFIYIIYLVTFRLSNSLLVFFLCHAVKI